MAMQPLGATSGVDLLKGLLPPVGAAKPAGTSAADAAKEKAEAARAANRAVLDEVRKKGIYAWAQETKLEKLKEKIRAEVMAERGLDDQSLAALPEEQRASTENSIQEEIARRIKEAMRDDFEARAKAEMLEGKPAAPMIIDVSV